MFNIAICDDEEILIDELKENLIKYDCVFKGGTFLSKYHHAIDRFSERYTHRFLEYTNDSLFPSVKMEVILQALTSFPTVTLPIDIYGLMFQKCLRKL